MYTHTHTRARKHKDAHTPSKENYLFHPHDQRSATELLYTWTCCTWNGNSRQDQSQQRGARENVFGTNRDLPLGQKGLLLHISSLANDKQSASSHTLTVVAIYGTFFFFSPYFERQICTKFTVELVSCKLSFRVFVQGRHTLMKANTANR